MSLEFTCPHCGARMRSVEGNCGDGASCAVCGKSALLVSPETATPSSGRRKSFIPPPAIWGIGLFMGIPFLAIIFALLLPVIHMMRESARKEKCAENLEKIEKALEDFEEKAPGAEADRSEPATPSGRSDRGQ